MNKLGQYFTKNEYLQNVVYSFIKNKPKLILEPSMGRGDLVKFVQSKIDVEFDCYEIDKTIELLPELKNEKITYCDFLENKNIKKYDTIIGNPPYVKDKKANKYIQFIDKCVNLLNDNGELIFIVPSDFLKLTSASSVITNMLDIGTFTDIVFPNDEKLFESASIDVMIFRYVKDSSLPKTCSVDNCTKFIHMKNGIITFSDNSIDNSHSTFCEYFDIYVGIVSGKDSVFKNDTFGNIDVLNSNQKIEKFIFLNSFPTNNEELNNYMLSYKDVLLSRKIKKFSESDWFKWGALRNYNTILNNLNKPCLYVHNLSRSNSICFVGNVQLFSGSLLIMIPKRNSLNLHSICNYINSDSFRKNYTYSNRFKIGHKQLSNALFNPSNFL